MEDAMNIAMQTTSTFTPWSEEPSARANRRKIRARLGGHWDLGDGTVL